MPKSFGSKLTILSFIINLRSGPYHEDQGDPIPFTGFSMIDYPIPNQPPENTR